MLTTYNFTTGPAILPDIGVVNYNGCIFSPLFGSSVSGRQVGDEANRTVKYVEYTIVLDGYVTLSDGLTDISQTMTAMRQLLSAQGGYFTYQGRGFNLDVNRQGGGGIVDVAWGPIPKILEFQPLGGGLSAKIKWQVVINVTEQDKSKSTWLSGIPLLQFSYDTSVEYNEEGYSSLNIRGVMEIGLNRGPQGSRTLKQTVDDVRSQVQLRVMNNIDWSKFRATQRSFQVSRDKRTMQFSVKIEETPYMQTPPYCTVADGSYTVRPASAGKGLALWRCVLRATYTVRADMPRRMAWLAFLSLLRWRMAQNNVVTTTGNGTKREFINIPPIPKPAPGTTGADLMVALCDVKTPPAAKTRSMWLYDFNVDEGLYKSSRTVSFSAAWQFGCDLRDILIDSGIWKKVPQAYADGKNLWATTMSDVQGAFSWNENTLDPNADIIVDFGGG